MLRRITQIIVLVGCFGFGVSAQAGIVFDNFGPGDSFNPNSGMTIGFSGDNVEQGIGFSPSRSGFLTELFLPVNHVSDGQGGFVGPNELDIWVMSDSSGEPGSILESFNLIDEMGEFGSSSTILNILASGTTFLDAASQYYVIASAPNDETWAAWNMTTLSGTDPRAARSTGDPSWSVTDSGSRGALRVIADVPEPATLALFGLGLAGLGFARKKKNSA